MCIRLAVCTRPCCTSVHVKGGRERDTDGEVNGKGKGKVEEEGERQGQR